MSKEFPLGILGGGQLAMMLSEAASRLTIPHLAYCTSNGDPVAHTDASLHFGNSSSTVELKNFLSRCDKIAFESEFVSCSMLEEISSDIDIEFIPSLSTMSLFQNKARQKQFLKKHGIPTAEFEIFDPTSNVLLSWISDLESLFPGGTVLKWATLGYDGHGTFFLRSPQDRDAAINFCNEALSRGSEIIAEALIHFDYEAAIIGVRSKKSFLSYPLVCSKQENGICLDVWGPLRNFTDNGDLLEKEGISIASSISSNGELLGAFGVEYFVIGNTLLVNEIAPRVHNTGHYTQDASNVSQFENHIRAVLNLDLIEPKTEAYFFMRNVLGPKIEINSGVNLSRPKGGDALNLHWYEKKDIRPGRKLGHINGHAQTIDELRKLQDNANCREKEWINDLTKN